MTIHGLQLARSDEELLAAYDLLLARMRADRAALAVVEDSEESRRLGVVTAFSWITRGGESGPMTDGPATAGRVRSELAAAERAARGAVVGRYDARAWRARGVADLLAFALGEADTIPVVSAAARRAA